MDKIVTILLMALRGSSLFVYKYVTGYFSGKQNTYEVCYGMNTEINWVDQSQRKVGFASPRLAIYEFDQPNIILSQSVTNLISYNKETYLNTVFLLR